MKKEKELETIFLLRPSIQLDVMLYNLLLMDNQEQLLSTTTFLSQKIKQVLKILPFVKVKAVKMKFGSNLLKKHGQNSVEVTSHLKWEDVQNSFKILMELLLKYFGLMIISQTLVKSSSLEK